MSEDLKRIPFGSVNTYKASNALEDNEALEAKNIVVDKRIGEISSIGPWSRISTGRLVTSFFKNEGNLYTQSGVSLYKDGVLIYTLATPDRLWYLPFRGFVGVSYILFTNNGGSYKYDGTSVTRLGIVAPTESSPPVIDTITGSNYRSYVEGTCYSNMATSDFSGLLRQKNVVVNHSLIDSASSSRVYASPVVLDGKTSKELYLGTSAGKGGGWITTAIGIGLPTPVLIIKLNPSKLPNWGSVTGVFIDLKSTVPYPPGTYHFDFIGLNLSNVEKEPQFTQRWIDTGDVETGYLGTVGPGLTVRDFSRVLRVTPSVALNVESDPLYLDLSSLTLGQKNSIKHIALSLSTSELGYYKNYPGDQIAWAFTKSTIFAVDSMYFSGTSSLGKLHGDGYSWMYTYKSDSGMESKPSGASATVSMISSKASVSVVASSQEGVDSIVLYRTSGIRPGWYKVAELTNSTQTYVDNIAEADLTDEYTTDKEFYSPAINGLRGLIQHSNRVFAYKDNVVYNSEINNPEAWGDGLSNKTLIGDSSDILGLASFDTILFVMKDDNKVYQMRQVGTNIFDVKNSTIPDKIVSENACISEDGITFLGESGIYKFLTMKPREISLPVRDKFLGASAFLFRAGNRIVCTSPGLILNTVLDTITELDAGTITFADSFDGNIYLGYANGDIIYEDKNGLEYPFNGRYQTKDFEYNLPLTYKHGRRCVINATFYTPATVTMSFMADGAIKYTRNLVNGLNSFSLPPTYKGLRLSILITTTGNVRIKTPQILVGELSENP